MMVVVVGDIHTCLRDPSFLSIPVTHPSPFHNQVNETAALVLAVFPDLTLALREGEMAMAQSFFLSIKNWCVAVYCVRVCWGCMW